MQIKHNRIFGLPIPNTFDRIFLINYIRISCQEMLAALDMVTYIITVALAKIYFPECSAIQR